MRVNVAMGRRLAVSAGFVDRRLPPCPDRADLTGAVDLGAAPRGRVEVGNQSRDVGEHIADLFTPPNHR